MRTYTENRYGDYRETDAGNTIRSNGASCGGGSEVLVIETLVFDEGQITSPVEHSNPTWGGAATPLPATPEER